jgi:hypothetical protein
MAEIRKKYGVNEDGTPYEGENVVVYDKKGAILDKLPVGVAAKKYKLKQKGIRSQLQAQDFTTMQGAEGPVTVGRPVAEDNGDMVGFSLQTERAYQAVIDRFGHVIDHDEDSGIMYAPLKFWGRIQEVAYDADGIGAEEDTGYENPEHYGLEEAKDGYEQTGRWKDNGQIYGRWEKNYNTGKPADRHISIIVLQQERGQEPVYTALHRIEQGYWTNQSAHESPARTTHRSTHSSLEDAKQALEQHVDKLYKDKQGVAEGFEPGHREIERWATQSEENQKIYNAYKRAGDLAKKAWEEKDGASYTGLQLRKKQIRDLIAKKMSAQGVEEGAPKLLKAEMPLVRHIERELSQHGYEKGTPEYNEHFKHALSYYRKFGNIDQINKRDVAESLRDGEYYVYEVTFDDGTTTRIRSGNDWFDAKAYYAKQGKNVVKSERIGGIQGGDYVAPKKPHDFPDDSFAKAQRAYDRKLTNEDIERYVEELERAGYTVNEEETRLDPKCWTGYRKAGTKMKGGVRVNNCVPIKKKK